MIRILLLVLLFASTALGASSGTGIYPDAKLTPGAVNPKATEKLVCKKGYTSGRDVRHVTLTMKKQVFARYQIPWSEHSKYEVDHAISLELGGSNEIQNLWPEKYCPLKVKNCYGARQKDVVETNLHRRICRGEITLKHAQEIIRHDWLAEYKRIQGEKRH